LNDIIEDPFRQYILALIQTVVHLFFYTGVRANLCNSISFEVALPPVLFLGTHTALTTLGGFGEWSAYIGLGIIVYILV